MPQRTIYVKEEHQKLWEEVKELIGDESLSEVVAEGLQRVIDARKNVSGTFNRIELDIEGHTIGFQGHEVASTDEERWLDIEHENEHCAYVTPKGNILIYTEYSDDRLRGRNYKVFKLLSDAQKEKDNYGEPLYPPEFLSEIAEAMGEKYVEELDI